MQHLRIPSLDKSLRIIHLAKLELNPICLKAIGWASGPIRNILNSRRDINIFITWQQVIFTSRGLSLDWKVDTKTIDLDFLPRFLLEFLPVGAQIATLRASTFNNHGDPYVQDVVEELLAQYVVQTMVWHKPPLRQVDE